MVWIFNWYQNFFLKIIFFTTLLRWHWGHVWHRKKPKHTFVTTPKAKLNCRQKHQTNTEDSSAQLCEEALSRMQRSHEQLESPSNHEEEELTPDARWIIWSNSHEQREYFFGIEQSLPADQVLVEHEPQRSKRHVRGSKAPWRDTKIMLFLVE